MTSIESVLASLVQRRDSLVLSTALAALVFLPQSVSVPVSVSIDGRLGI